MDKDSWSKVIEGNSLDYDDKLDEIILVGHTLSYLHSDGLGKPTLKQPNAAVWFSEGICSICHISDFTGQMSKL